MDFDDETRIILQRQLDGLAPDPSVRPSLLSYSTSRDKVILLISFICAILGGILNPLIAVLFGQLAGVFEGLAGSSQPSSEAREQLVTYSLYWVYLSAAIFILIYVATVGFYYVGERIARALRNAYLKSIIRQNMAFFDTHEPGEVATRIMSDMTLVQEGITSKLSFALTAVANFVAAFAVALVVHWKLALIMCPFFVINITVGTLSGRHVIKYNKQARVANDRATSLAQEAISSVRHVYALGIQKQIAGKYEAFLKVAGQPAVKALYLIAAVVAWYNTVPALVHAVAFWAGTQFLVHDEISVAQITTLALVVVIGAFAIVRVAPAAQGLVACVSSASVILREMSRRSPQDPFDPSGQKVDDFKGFIEFRNVSLVYPKRPDSQVMDGVSFECPAMKTTAIVGSSGSGKSTIINLLERFYEPTGGQIYVDGVAIQDLNLRWLRGHMGLVRQQPVLFDTTIFENIRYGTVTSAVQLSGEGLEEQIIAVAKMANAHDFISALPDGYQTRVGENAVQLSGGQKQRIAIARALMRDPKVLLLDEATSALDTGSEAAVQIALNEAAKQRTTIVIAHRLSTIRHADNIVVMSSGRVVEQGTHDDLIASDGHYARLVHAQQIKGTSQDELDEEEDIICDDFAEAYVPEDDTSPVLKTVSATGRAPDDNTSAEYGAAQEKPKSWGLGNTLALIFRLNHKERYLLFFGALCSVIAGLEQPGRSVIFSKLLEVLSLYSSDVDGLQNQINLLAGILLVLGVLIFAVWIGIGFTFAIATNRLTRRVREGCFRSIVAQDVEFFDRKSNTTGNLLSLLSTSTDALIGLSGPVIGGTLTFIFTILGGVILSLIVGWKLALVCTATIPVVVACGWLRLQMLSIFDSHTRQNGIDAASYASEVVKSISTVASLNLEQFVLDRYDGFLAKQSESSLRSILGASSLYAASQSVVYLASALTWWVGGTLILDQEYTLFQFYICYMAIVSGSQVAASVFAFAPDASKAIHASWEISNMLEGRLAVLPDQRSVLSDQQMHREGQIRFENVSFAYPSRKTRLALDRFSLDIGAGQFVALVGPSGCGKSTILSLIERFYSPASGSILVDGQYLSTMEIEQHRRSISLVSQEAVLFSTSIRENIAMGLPGVDVSDEDIWRACRQANIEDFVMSLEDGLSTLVGPGGSMLSGGQKQRLEIARALLRNPSILLLDEATSALDTESEALVQKALEMASKHRTTIAVAHRLSTIKKADLICVLDHGRLVESGTHDELVRRKGAYSKLLELQDLQ